MTIWWEMALNNWEPEDHTFLARVCIRAALSSSSSSVMSLTETTFPFSSSLLKYQIKFHNTHIYIVQTWYVYLLTESRSALHVWNLVHVLLIPCVMEQLVLSSEIKIEHKTKDHTFLTIFWQAPSWVVPSSASRLLLWYLEMISSTLKNS